MQITRISDFGTPAIGTTAPASAPSRLVRLFQNWRMKQRVYREMGPMNDRELADLGITRLDVDRIANGDDVRRG
jgi:uncharacterized protein YjiS (DUF1127 family)